MKNKSKPKILLFSAMQKRKIEPVWIFGDMILWLKEPLPTGHYSFYYNFLWESRNEKWYALYKLAINPQAALEWLMIVGTVLFVCLFILFIFTLGLFDLFKLLL